MAQSVSIMQTRQNVGAAGATETRETRRGVTGDTTTSACRRTVMEWIQDRVHRGRSDSEVGRMDKGFTMNIYSAVPELST